jgi:hypothetical protein
VSHCAWLFRLLACLFARPLHDSRYLFRCPDVQSTFVCMEQAGKPSAAFGSHSLSCPLGEVHRHAASRDGAGTFTWSKAKQWAKASWEGTTLHPNIPFVRIATCRLSVSETDKNVSPFLSATHAHTLSRHVTAMSNINISSRFGILLP